MTARIQSRAPASIPGSLSRKPANEVLRSPAASVNAFPLAPADSEFEREADRLADAVMTSGAQPDAVQGKAPSDRQGREAKASREPPLEPVGAPVSGPISGSGRPLSHEVRRFFEPRFGFDFSSVRVHSDDTAATQARSIQARAFTLGSDIVFAERQFAPGSHDGRRLLAHELVHVVQQGRTDRGVGVLQASRMPAPSVQRQTAPQTGAGRDFGVGMTLGNDFYLSYRDHFPTIDDVLAMLVGNGVLTEEAASKLDAAPIGDARSPTGWSLSDPAIGEVVRFKYTLNMSSQMPMTAEGLVNLPGGSAGGANRAAPGRALPYGKHSPGSDVSPPDEAGPKEAPTEEELKSNSHYQRLSTKDRKLLDEYAKMSPEELDKDPSASAPNMQDVKVSIALKLSSSWPAEILETAKASFTDPSFVVMLVVTLAIYAGLWLVPEPSGVTKALAGLLTAILLLNFAWEDIYGLAAAWMDLEDDCKSATTVGELKVAGDKFAKKVGSVGFDILLFIATFALGKAFGPKLAKIGAERGVAKAKAGVSTQQANVAQVEARPGSGVAQPATPESTVLIDQAKANAKGTTATAVLDALADLLPESAKRGLRGMRDAELSGDRVLRVLEGKNKGGQDITKFLIDEGQSTAAREAVRTDLGKANAALARSQVELARARLIESRTFKDPKLRQAVREQQYATLRAALKKMGSLEGTELADALSRGDFQKIVSELRNILQEAAKPKVAETQGAVAEAIARATVEAKYAGRKGIQFLHNIAVMRRLGRFQSIAEWRVVEQARVRAEKPTITDEALHREVGRNAAHLFEEPKAARVYDAVGEVDVMVLDANGPGKPVPIEFGEIKSGANDTPTKAQAQIDKAVGAFAELSKAGAGSDLKVFELLDKKTLGKDLTNAVEFGRADGATRTAIGPRGRAFVPELDFTTAELNGLAQSLLKSLPRANPQIIPPLVSPDRPPGQPEQSGPPEHVP